MALPPGRLTGNDLGGPKEDEGTPTNDRKYYTARQINLTHQIAIGMNLVTPRALVLTEWSGSEMTIIRSGETWDPDEELVPTVTRPGGAGQYVIEYAASYTDYDGEPIPPALWAAEAELQTLNKALEARAVVQSDGRTVDVWVWHKDTDLFTDARVLVKVY